MSLSLAIAIIIFVLIAIRQWLPMWLRIWHIMSAGALFIIISGQSSLAEASRAVDWNVIAYLFAVFSIASALYDSGVSHRLSNRLTRGHHHFGFSLFALMLLAAIGAAVLTNDAAAVIGTPIALSVARLLKLRPTVLLVGLCVAVTIGSMMTPVGNPQNILIAAKGHIENPLGSFLYWLTVPTIISLLMAFLWLWFFQQRWGQTSDKHLQLPEPSDETAAWPAYLSVILLVFFIAVDSILQGVYPEFTAPLGLLGLLSCLPVYLFNSRRLLLFREVDWATLMFFVAMFVVTGSVLASGDLQRWLGPMLQRLDEPEVIVAISYWASQLFSNVPVVEIYLQLLDNTFAIKRPISRHEYAQ